MNVDSAQDSKIKMGSLHALQSWHVVFCEAINFFNMKSGDLNLQPR